MTDDLFDRINAVPPFSWALAFNHWCADHLVRPWLQPLIRPLERRLARTKIRELVALRAMCAGRPEVQARFDELITHWTRRYVELGGQP